MTTNLYISLDKEVNKCEPNHQNKNYQQLLDFKPDLNFLLLNVQSRGKGVEVPNFGQCPKFLGVLKECRPFVLLWTSRSFIFVILIDNVLVS